MGSDGRVLVVGAGFAGAVYARSLAEAGFEVDVVERRGHVAGNAYDEVDGNGVRVHRYGPHLFHTSNARVAAWLERFGRWEPYAHRVRAVLDDGRFVPLPINRATVNTVFDANLASPDQVEAFLARVAEKLPAPRNAAEHLYARIGRRLTDLFFRPYTRKMWDLDLEDLDEAVVRRIPLRFDDEDRYFPDACVQAIPRDGYAALFEAIFDHPAICVSLGVEYRPGLEGGYVHCFNSMPIDVFFGGVLGDLPYRSIRFHHRTERAAAARGWSVTNFVDDGPFTRETWWHLIPGHLRRETGARTLTREEPCDYRDNGFERYYPVKTADGRHRAVYLRYKAMADRLPGMTFIGRCGTYQYLDMDQVINQSLAGADRWLGRAAAGVPTARGEAAALRPAACGT